MDTLKSVDVHAGQLRVLFEEKKGDGERKKERERKGGKSKGILRGSDPGPC